MNNKDLPAFARSATIDHNASQIGLTKRELIAAMCLSSMVEKGIYANGDNHKAYFCQQAIECADELLNQLSKP